MFHVRTVRAFLLPVPVLIVAFVCATAIAQDGGSITAGTPARTGIDEWNVHLTGEADGFKISVGVKKEDTAAAKAIKIRDKINEARPGKASIDPNDATKVKFNGKALQTKNGSGQGVRTGMSTDPFPPSLGVIDFHGTPSGVDESGGESEFASSLGYDGLVADSSRSFSELSGPTLTNLLQDTYSDLLADLPGPLQPSLHLDLANERIVFDLPVGQTNYFVSNFTSDVTVEPTGGHVYVPEPSTLALIGLGVGLLHRRRGRR